MQRRLDPNRLRPPALHCTIKRRKIRDSKRYNNNLTKSECDAKLLSELSLPRANVSTRCNSNCVTNESVAKSWSSLARATGTGAWPRIDNSTKSGSNDRLWSKFSLQSRNESNRCNSSSTKNAKLALQPTQLPPTRPLEVRARFVVRETSIAGWIDGNRLTEYVVRLGQGVTVGPEIDPRWMIPLDHLTIDESSHLGAGALGEVMRATWNNSMPVAAKRLFFMSNDPVALRAMGGALDTTTRADALRAFLKECSINSSIRHPNIVMFLGVGADRSSNDEPRFLVLELMEGGSLHDEIYPRGVSPREGAPMTLDRIASILLDVSRALVYLHHSRTPPILHLDLKPRNVLIDGSGRAKIGDLGEAHVIRATRRATRTLSAFAVGTPGYMAPEMAIEGAERGRAADMFSLGVMACEMSSGRPPNPGPSLVRTSARDFRMVPESERRAADTSAMQHSEIRELVDHLIVDEARQRWDARQAQSFLESIVRRGRCT